MRRALVLAIVLATASTAWAKSEKVEPWTAGEVFPAAVRFLRIDAGVTIVEKDADAGYVLFDLAEEGRKFRGALELVKTEVDGRESVKLVLRIDDRPAYEEQMLLDKLDQKIRGELGMPKRPDKKPEKPKDDGSGTGAGTGTGT